MEAASGDKELTEQLFDMMAKLAKKGRIPTFEPLLPFLRLKGKPYTLKDHFPFSPLFRIKRPKILVIQAGRQVSKSTSIAARGVITGATIPFYNILYVAPLSGQISRFSNNYVKPFIETSPLKHLWTGPDTERAVLQRSFRNHSKMIFTFTTGSADRARGVTADEIYFDEVQDIDIDSIPIVKQTSSHSVYEFTNMTGTPKTLDGPLTQYLNDSSYAEWFIKCQHCEKYNIPSREYHIEGMIGPAHDGISEKTPGTLCYWCQKPINPRFGRWVHRYPERRWTRAGYHIPQIIMPIHYSRPDKWAELVRNQDQMAPNQFWNEILGEAYDTGAKLISETELKAACVLPWKNEPRSDSPSVVKKRHNYLCLAMGIDWGGGGEKGLSFTTIAVVGIYGTGEMDCLWGRRLLTPNDHLNEAYQILRYVQIFDPHIIAHDFSGAGSLRETILVQAGVPNERLVPFSLIGNSAELVRYVPPNNSHPRGFYRLNKTRSLLYTIAAIRQKKLRFFQYDYENNESPGLIRDFLSLIEEKRTSDYGTDAYLIRKSASAPDDFAHAVNFATASIWTRFGWPDFVNVGTNPSVLASQF